MTNIVQINAHLKKLGTDLCTIRKSIPQTQQDIAEWLNTDRRVIAKIESGHSHNLQIIALYCEKMSVDFSIFHAIH